MSPESAILGPVKASELRRLREHAGVTQQQLADAGEVTERTIRRWEAGDVPIPALAARGLRELLAEMKRRKK